MNPTLLNGLPVSLPTRLSVGDLIKMSETLLRVAPTRDAKRTGEALTAARADSAVYRPAAA